jgi:Icc protein
LQARQQTAWQDLQGERTINEENTPMQAIKVLQITDTHLFGEPDGCLLGLNTEQSLKAVIADVAGKHLPADLVLATGDLAHQPTPAAYERLFANFSELGLPVYCLPGNHDEGQLLQSASGDGLCRFEAQAHHGGWHFVFLDSTIPGSEGAHLTQDSLQQLDEQLQSAPDAHTLVCLHHQPVLMGSRWLDTMALDNPDEFFAVIDRHPQVRGILWGHVHQEFTDTRKGVRLISTPSTCIQFKPDSNDFALDMTSPGYRWLILQPDGGIETGVERLADMPGTIDLAASGY